MAPDVVVIIGTGGMGEAIARRQGSGNKLLLADLDEKLLDDRVQNLTADGFEVDSQPVDVSSRQSVESLADRAAFLGPVTQVVHTAGLSPAQAPADAILRVDLLGVALTLDAFGRVIDDGGAGVVIASMAGHLLPLPPDQEKALLSAHTDTLLSLDFLKDGPATNPAYAYPVAKRANQLRVRAASTVWGKRGARINSVSPGVIATAMGQAELSGESGDAMQAMIAMSGTGRIGTASDIADAVSFLLSPAASFITGIDLLVDGGVTAAVAAAQTV